MWIQRQKGQRLPDFGNWRIFQEKRKHDTPLDIRQ
jgi:hypothetical protein